MSGNFIVYLIGYIIAIIGVGYGLNAAGVGTQWIIPVVLVMIGLGIVYALSRSQRDEVTRSSTAQNSWNQSESAKNQGQASTQSSGGQNTGSQNTGGQNSGNQNSGQASPSTSQTSSHT